MKDMAQEERTNRSDKFVRALGYLLRPLARALIAHGVTAPAFYRVVKQAYVDAAIENLAKSDAKVTDSRVSILTGVHRRDVKVMRESDQTEDAASRAKISVLASVVGKWLASEDTTDENGAPLPLPRMGDGSFEALVQSISRDIRPRTVLDELTRQGLVTTSQDGEVAIATDAFLGSADMDHQLHFFASNLGDHISAAVENILADTPPFMERAVFYNRLKASSVSELEAEARTKGTELLKGLNRKAQEMQNTDKDDPSANERFRLGVFFFRSSEPTETDPT